MTRTAKQPPDRNGSFLRQLAARLAALEKEVDSLRITLGDLKYEVEQMVEA